LVGARRQQDERRTRFLLEKAIGSLPGSLGGQIQVEQHGRELAGTQPSQRIGHPVHLHNGSTCLDCDTPEVLAQTGIVADEK
jgi:hypothetical protein